MPVIRTIHVGVIVHKMITLKILTAATKHQLLYDLNSWFFDYFRTNGYPVEQLPPLDDWIHSSENDRYWQITFPNNEWTVWIRSDTLEL